MLLMRARGVRDLDLLRALERAPRGLFMPQRYGDIAGRDIALPIGCGQTAPPPSMVAAMIEALDVDRHHSILEIGAGTGYATALIAQLAGKVLTLERFQSLALEAATRLESFGVANVVVAWTDALGPHAPAGPFDRILIHALLDGPMEAFHERLAPDGVIVAARTIEREGRREQRLIRVSRHDDEFALEDIGAARSLAPLHPGLSKGA